jgi:hypothetical protein
MDKALQISKSKKRSGRMRKHPTATAIRTSNRAGADDPTDSYHKNFALRFFERIIFVF